MPYTPFIPKKPGIHILPDISIATLLPYIDWRFFFMAWKLTGKYSGINEVCECQSCQVGWLQQFSEPDRTKAKEALILYKDAQQLLKDAFDNKHLTVQGIIGLFAAKSENEGIILHTKDQLFTYPLYGNKSLKKKDCTIRYAILYLR
jgi:5-methyltetrahydrofolate--homocysteine methyltransferase